MRVLILMAHPDEGSFNEKMAERYRTGAERSGAEVRMVRLRDLAFDPILHAGYREPQALEEDLVVAQENLLWADHLVITYPTWWGDVPALLKGFIDRVMLPKFAFTSDGKSIPKGLLTGKSARILSTMDAPAIYNWIVKAPGTNMLKRATLKFCGFKPVKSKTFYGLRNTPQEKREQLLKEIEIMGRKII